MQCNTLINGEMQVNRCREDNWGKMDNNYISMLHTNADKTEQRREGGVVGGGY